MSAREVYTYCTLTLHVHVDMLLWVISYHPAVLLVFGYMYVQANANLLHSTLIQCDLFLFHSHSFPIMETVDSSMNVQRDTMPANKLSLICSMVGIS